MCGSEMQTEIRLIGGRAVPVGFLMKRILSEVLGLGRGEALRTSRTSDKTLFIMGRPMDKNREAGTEQERLAKG